MAVRKSNRAGDSGAEEQFVQLFCDVFGVEKGQYVYLQHPFVDIYGNHRTIDFAVMTEDGKIAFEIDGETWHNPAKVSHEKYVDDLLKQNSMIFEGWKVFRWTDSQVEKTPERVKDELITFLGYSPALTYFDNDTPSQQGSVFELREHQEEALSNLIKMREEGKTIALVQGATGSGKSAIGVLDAKKVGKRVLFLAHTKELVEQGAGNFTKLWPEVSVGRFYENYHDADAFVVCGSIQSVIRNLDLFKPDDFDYLIIDECHHASAKQVLKEYAEKEIQVLCACDLLNEGWDSPITEVLFMARPTMSKVIYSQQLGRGMRTHEGKEFLMVFDFVDNANMFNCPYSLHRLLNVSEYVPGGMVLGSKHAMAWDKDMFTKGEKPAVLVDFPIHVMGYEVIDIFIW